MTVSTRGGNAPCWSRDGRELFYYVAPAHKMIRVRVDLASNAISAPEELVEAWEDSYPIRGCDVHPDGKRFLFTTVKAPLPFTEITRLRLVQNWFEELKKVGTAGTK